MTLWNRKELKFWIRIRIESIMDTPDIQPDDPVFSISIGLTGNPAGYRIFKN
jgi:hypothetical protein